MQGKRILFLECLLDKAFIDKVYQTPMIVTSSSFKVKSYGDNFVKTFMNRLAQSTSISLYRTPHITQYPFRLRNLSTTARQINSNKVTERILFNGEINYGRRYKE